MPAPRFYVPTLAPGDVDLPDAEARHAGGSLRLGRGDAVVLFDGCGCEADAVLTQIGPGVAVARVAAVRMVPRSARVALTIATAASAPPRQDWLVEKCTELGVAAIWPVAFERSEAGLSATRRQRLQRVCTAAAKQSQQAWLPELRELAPLADVLARLSAFDLALSAEPVPAAPPLPPVLAQHADASRIIALIGPEGGLTDAEADAVRAAGAVACRLTPTILRIETAAIALASVVLAAGDGRSRAAQ